MPLFFCKGRIIVTGLFFVKNCNSKPFTTLFLPGFFYFYACNMLKKNSFVYVDGKRTFLLPRELSDWNVFCSPERVSPRLWHIPSFAELSALDRLAPCPSEKKYSLGDTFFLIFCKKGNRFCHQQIQRQRQKDTYKKRENSFWKQV